MVPMLNWIKHSDTNLFFLINREGKNALFDALMPVVSEIELFLIPIAVFWVMLILKKDAKTRTVAIMIVLVLVTSDLVSARVMKPLFQRPRPYNVLSGVHYHRQGEWRVTPEKMAPKKSTNFSLPSSHATNIFAAAVFLSWFFPGFAWLYLLLALLVSFSRPYLGMHYPLDLVAGGVLGTGIGIFYAVISARIIEWIRGRRTPLKPAAKDA